MGIRRNIAALLLSAVFLPTLLLAPLHRHTSVADGVAATAKVACAGCESHIPHSHLNDVAHSHECLVCQFLTVVWVPSDGEAPVIHAGDFTGLCTVPSCPLVSVSVSVPSGRAPPTVFC
ncbi:MAG: hypothetical protein IJL42_03835 [Bacteroidales bacterium]|nr:hypothetical protein [Bacteroidales bacterium]MBR4228525.1 hypothetical protein [Bacteroidales bacterium]